MCLKLARRLIHKLIVLYRLHNYDSQPVQLMKCITLVSWGLINCPTNRAVQFHTEPSSEYIVSGQVDGEDTVCGVTSCY